MDPHISLHLDSPTGPESELVSRVSTSGSGMDLASWKRLFRYAYSLVGNEAEAEDLTQEAFTELFQTQATGKPIRWIGAWMRTVTRRLAYRTYRKQRPDLHMPLETTTQEGKRVSWEPADTQPSPEKRVIDQIMVHLSAKVLSEFSDRERECVLMYFRGYDFSQIASALGVSRWTARRVTLDVIQKVRQRLQPPRD